MWQFPARTLSVKVGGSWRHLLTKKKTYQTSECYRSGWCVILLLYSYFLCSLARHLSVTLHAKIPLSQNDAAAVWTKLTPTRPLLQPFTQSPPSEIQVSCLGRFLWGEGDECGMCFFGVDEISLKWRSVTFWHLGSQSWQPNSIHSTRDCWVSVLKAFGGRPIHYIGINNSCLAD